MRKLQLYLETSIFGFYFDEEEKNVEKKEAVRKLLSQIKEGLMDGFISGLVIRELSKSPTRIAEEFFRIIKEHNIKEFETDEDEVQLLSEKYIHEGIIPVKVANDAIHVALATIGEFDVIVTLNCEHIANELKIRRFKIVNYNEGYTRELSIRTPMEVIQYEN